MIHILLLSNSLNNVASFQKNRGGKSHCVIVALGMLWRNELDGKNFRPTQKFGFAKLTVSIDFGMGVKFNQEA